MLLSVQLNRHVTTLTLFIRFLLLCLETSTSLYSVRRECHASVFTYWEDFSLAVAVRTAIAALVDDELSHTMLLSIHVGFHGNPSRCITDAEIVYLAIVDKTIECLHHLRNRCGVVVPVDVKLDISISA
jgi:hypothetical protein